MNSLFQSFKARLKALQPGNTLLGAWFVLLLCLLAAAATFGVTGVALRAWHWMLVGLQGVS